MSIIGDAFRSVVRTVAKAEKAVVAEVKADVKAVSQMVQTVKDNFDPSMLGTGGAPAGFGKDLVETLKKNLMTPDVFTDAHEQYLYATEKGKPKELMRELVDRLKDADGDPNLSKGERAKLDRAIQDVHGGSIPKFTDNLLAHLGGAFNRPKPLNETEVRAIAGRLGISLKGTGNADTVLLKPGSEGDKYVRSLPIQGEAQGVGPKVTRDYKVEINGADANKVFADLQNNFPKYIDPKEAHFYPTKSPVGVGDRFYIESHMESPIDGTGLPNDVKTGVEVLSANTTGNPKTFTLATLKNHPEAGKITFSVKDLGGGKVEVSIHSEAKFGGRAAQAAYGAVGKDSQTRIWEGFLSRAVQHSGGTQAAPATFGFKED